MWRIASVTLVVALSAGAVTPLAGEPGSSPPEGLLVIEAITVGAARPAATAGGASAVSAVVDSLPSPPSPTAEEVLRELPLVLVRANSRGEAQPQLRGMESRQVAVLVDGVPITLGWDNRTDLSVLPLTAARRLTVVRGLSSVLHGPNALGGVVLATLGESREAQARASPLDFALGVDHLGNSAFALGLERFHRRAGGDDLVLSAGGGYRKRSAWPLASGVVERIPTDDGRRLNSDYEQLNGYIVARVS